MLSRSRVRRAVPPSDADRSQIARLLARRSIFERAVLSLLLIERMTPAEVGAALGLTAADVSRACRRLLAGFGEADHEPVSVPVLSERRESASRRRAA